VMSVQKATLVVHIGLIYRYPERRPVGKEVLSVLAKPL